VVFLQHARGFSFPPSAMAEGGKSPGVVAVTAHIPLPENLYFHSASQLDSFESAS